MREEEYGDKIILSLRQNYIQRQSEDQKIEQTIVIEGIPRAVHREEFFGGSCSLLIPDLFTDMKALDAAVRYKNRNRPEVIKAEQNGDGALTLSLLSADETGGKGKASDLFGTVRQNMAKVWKQAVFYDTGEVQTGDRKIPWMDLKTFGLNGAIYSLIFLFDLNEDIVLGNFHCSFQRYDIWKQVILKLLTTYDNL